MNIGLSNGGIIENVIVCGSDLGDSADVLIGMDVISLGDFSITNKDGKTTFSFREPSMEETDYTKSDNNTTPNP